MSEFTKLGGYLIQGQPEVVHDSALSGNGLEGSPLGLSEEFITGTMRPATQSALNLNIGHPENNYVAEAGATIGSNNAAASTGLAVGFGASAFGMSIAVGEDTHASNRGIAVGNGLDANGIAAFGTYNFEINTGHNCIFVVGNGTDSANRSDAFKIYKDGRVEAPNFVTTNNVQLSALTGVSEANDLVHSNSGTWNEVTGKLDASAVNSALRPPYGAIVLGIDNIPISAKVSDSANYAKFDENGTYLTSYLTAVPTGTMNETAFAYDSDNLIASYNGSAFAATLPASADAMLETVYRSGAVWDTVTGKLDRSASSSFYTTANESGFLTGLPIDISVRDLNASRHVRATTAGQDIYGNFDFAGMYFRSGSQRPYNIGIDNTGSNFYIATAKNGYERIYASSIQNWNSKGDMFESAFSYDASDNITAYNGSAFKAGDEFPQSATEAIETVTANSANWNGTTETVSSNSGAWNNVSAKLDISAFTLSALNDASANNIILTASLPVTPDANTLYLIPEV